MRSESFGRSLWVSWIGVMLVLLLWQFVIVLRLVNPAVFPGPLQVVDAAFTRVPLPDLISNVTASLMRVVIGFAIGAGLGVILGIASGWYRLFGRILWPPLEILRPIPPLAWIPLALLWFGLGEESKIFIISLGAFFPVITNTYKGMIEIDPALLRIAQTMGLRGVRLLAQVAFPASLPDIATGLRVGWSLSFGSLVAAEILAAQKGLGFMIMHARELGEISVIVYGIILIGLLNLITDYLLNKLILQRQLRWHFGSENVLA
jgi:ABC-type nitrate/sulfonate/bicarbonate transport system permease component